MPTPRATPGCGHRTRAVPGYLNQPATGVAPARQFDQAGRVLLILSLTRAPPH
ncbi:hypothetical protein [Herbiconiux ginsengi]|uniref:hypothetical protein n=1 Tax=Herbiconiux ginsengi TaxID=381665 RepID=UPI001587CB14|nr:hypothetical protein [Herbiconiux ginsengi]